MHQLINTSFPSFQKDLVDNITQHCTIMDVTAGTIIMKTGQYIRNTVLVVKGKIVKGVHQKS